MTGVQTCALPISGQRAKSKVNLSEVLEPVDLQARQHGTSCAPLWRGECTWRLSDLCLICVVGSLWFSIEARIVAVGGEPATGRMDRRRVGLARGPGQTNPIGRG